MLVMTYEQIGVLYWLVEKLILITRLLTGSRYLIHLLAMENKYDLEEKFAFKHILGLVDF